jgi:hypothetical protein
MKKSLGELFIESEDGVCDVKEQEVAYTWIFFYTSCYVLKTTFWLQEGNQKATRWKDMNIAGYALSYDVTNTANIGYL